MDDEHDAAAPGRAAQSIPSWFPPPPPSSSPPAGAQFSLTFLYILPWIPNIYLMHKGNPAFHPLRAPLTPLNPPPPLCPPAQQEWK